MDLGRYRCGIVDRFTRIAGEGNGEGVADAFGDPLHVMWIIGTRTEHDDAAGPGFDRHVVVLMAGAVQEDQAPTFEIGAVLG